MQVVVEIRQLNLRRPLTHFENRVSKVKADRYGQISLHAMIIRRLIAHEKTIRKG